MSFPESPGCDESPEFPEPPGFPGFPGFPESPGFPGFMGMIMGGMIVIGFIGFMGGFVGGFVGGCRMVNVVVVFDWT